jgi:hypothetical protein
LEQLVDILQVTPNQEENSPFPRTQETARPPRVNKRLPVVYPIFFFKGNIGYLVV